MKSIVPGLLAGLVATAALAAPALAAPANVTVRVEGDAADARPAHRGDDDHGPGRPGRTPTPVRGTSAVGRARPGDGRRHRRHVRPGFATYLLERGQGRDARRPASGSGAYWSFWINDTHASAGICGRELQEGDDVSSSCRTATRPTDALPSLSAAAAERRARRRSRRAAVTVARRRVQASASSPSTRPPDDGRCRRPAPPCSAGGATATDRGGRRRRQLTLAGAGPVAVTATKPGRTVRHGSHLRDDRRRRRLRHARSRRRAARHRPSADTTAPVASISGLEAGKVFSRRKAPARALRARSRPTRPA